MEKPLVNKKFKLEKYPGKGGWTYTILPGFIRNTNIPFRWVKVKGFIDNYEIKNYNLMPVKGGKLFLPIKAEIRKRIKKEAGDWVKIVLYPDFSTLPIPTELLSCLKDEPRAYNNFMSFTEGEQKAFINWIYSAKMDETIVQRIAATVDKASKGLKFQDKD
jgi:hypothetical protein